MLSVSDPSFNRRSCQTRVIDFSRSSAHAMQHFGPHTRTAALCFGRSRALQGRTARFVPISQASCRCFAVHFHRVNGDSRLIEIERLECPWVIRAAISASRPLKRRFLSMCRSRNSSARLLADEPSACCVKSAAYVARYRPPRAARSWHEGCREHLELAGFARGEFRIAGVSPQRKMRNGRIVDPEQRT